MSTRVYEDEYQFLQDSARAFAEEYPDIAQNLKLESKDPDVERLLQGFAFLTGRISHFLHGQFPELLFPLLQWLMPHVLQPTPSATILEFWPAAERDLRASANRLRGPVKLENRTRIDSVPLPHNGVVCSFETTSAITILPLFLESAKLDTSNVNEPLLLLGLKSMAGTSLAFLADEPLRLFLASSTLRQAYGLYHSLAHQVRGIKVHRPGVAPLTFDKSNLKPLGFSVQEALLPIPPHSFPGFRHLHDYFMFPAKYLFFELSGLAGLRDGSTGDQLTIAIELSQLDVDVTKVGQEDFLLNCVPAVNLVTMDAEPIRLNQTKVDYEVRPAVKGKDSVNNYEIFGIKEVSAALSVSSDGVRRTAAPVPVSPLYSFRAPLAVPSQKASYYYLLRRRLIGTPVQRFAGADEVEESHRQKQSAPVPAYLSFVQSDGSPIASAGTVSVQLLVTNRSLPIQYLGRGDISVPTMNINSSSAIKISNYGPISPPGPTPVDSLGKWRFFSHLLWGFSYLKDPGAFRALLAMHHPIAAYDHGAGAQLGQLLSAIQDVSAVPEDAVLGLPPTVLRGTHVMLTMLENKLGHWGQVYLFGQVLSRFLAETTNLNTFARLTIHGGAQQKPIHYPRFAGVQEMV